MATTSTAATWPWPTGPRRPRRTSSSPRPRATPRCWSSSAVGNPDNVGSLFRNAAAFGAAGVVLSPGCADPFYRKAIRTSAGATLRLPFATASDWPAALRALRARGYLVAALTPPGGAAGVATVELGDFAARRPRRPVALVVGTEGDGLTAAALAEADVRVQITIDPSVDSLNVATAAAVALHRLYPVGVPGP